ncbi:unnamed protein product [Peronospora farinosa]|uniref:HSF-type DNA-binding domain-containing protein n=1 Tax=Peronospora farinosa TaxID=134698 RepID=A0ABN8CEL1_9STRA|nr:unnamed protein product [Peronospora farinosa]
MATGKALFMDSITHHIDIKQEPQVDAFQSTDSANQRRVSKSRQVERAHKTMHLLPQQNEWKLSTIKEGGKRAKPEAPKFLLLLYEILEVESSRVIRWSEDGLALQILDPLTVTEQILPKYFNHTNFHSFQRQLNYFGFRKWTKSKTDISPRRTPASGANSSASSTPTASAASSTSKKLSPCGKWKLSSDSSNSEDCSTESTGMRIQMMNTSAVQIQPATKGIPLSAMTTPHSASSHAALGFSQDGSTRHYLLDLNNVISPVAATECKKKAKKHDKKNCPASATMHAQLTSPLNGSAVPSIGVEGFMSSSSVPADSNNASLSSSSRTSSDIGYASITAPTSAALPTLNIVRSRLIQRQQAGGPEQQYEYSSFSGFSAPNGPQGMVVPTMENLSELSTQSLTMAPTSRTELNSDQSQVLSNSFSDPVNILLRIKKSRTSSGEVGSRHEQVDGRNESLTSLHNYLLGNSLFTNRLQAQLKFVAEENEALRNLLDSKQHEINTLQGERKVLQQENAVLLEDKNKLFEMNRDLLSKLFPQ